MVASSAVRLRRDGLTLNCDLLTPKSNQFISVPRCTSDQSFVKIRLQILEISRKHKTTTWITDGRTHRGTHGRTAARQTTRKHIASAGAYRRRRLKSNNNNNNTEDNVLVNGKCQISVSASSETLGSIFKNFCTVDYVMDPTSHAIGSKGPSLRMREIVTLRRLFFFSFFGFHAPRYRSARWTDRRR